MCHLAELIDKALEIASRPNVIFTSFGDMLRVPGSKKDLLLSALPAAMCGWSIHRWMP
jgi:hydrogenase expression/formation protein HypD